MKAYVHGYELQPQPLTTKLRMEFDASRETAHSWRTKAEAEAVCRRIEEEYSPITIPAADGKPCKGFQVEERAARQFVVFCEYPPR